MGITPLDAGTQGSEKAFEANVDKAVAKLNRLWAEAGTTMDDISLEARHRALELDQQMTDKANAGDLAGARVALAEWQKCWMSE
jgi:hypothetical protein